MTLTLFSEEIEESMRDAVLDYRANPEITKNCPKNLDFCKKETKFDPTIDEDGGKIEGQFWGALGSVLYKLAERFAGKLGRNVD